MTVSHPSEDLVAERANAIGLETAYPFQERDASGMPRSGPEYGLTKRELFAAMVMGELSTYYTDEFAETGAAKCAEVAVKYADALLKELAK